MINKKSQQELIRFLFTGILAVATDFASYFLLVEYYPADVAKAVSFVLGSVIAFTLNKIWTFESDAATAPALVQFSLLYAMTFFANVAVNHVVLVWLVDIRLIGFLCATATSTVLNFIGMKFWVFKINEQAMER